MAKDTFGKAMPHVFQVEGGYADNPKDPGGATNMGITLATLSAWRGHPMTKMQVKNLTKDEAAQIYKAQYWDKVMGDELPAGLDYAVFDFAINSGPARAAKALQKIVGVEPDGIIGAKTITAARKFDTSSLITRYCDDRLAWMRTLGTWSTFGKGWASRVSHVREVALAFAADGLAVPTPRPDEAPTASAPAEQKDVSIAETLKKPEAWGPLAGLVTGFGALASGSGPVQYALAAALVIGVLTGVWFVIRRERAAA